MPRTTHCVRTGWAARALIITCCLGLASPPATADEAALAQLDPVRVTAGTPTPGASREQAASIDVLEGEDKTRRETASLGQTLAHLPGVSALTTGNNVGKPVIRGLSGNRIRILSNGIGVDHQQFGTRHSPNIDPFLSSRIEVVRGASSILYGSDALGGVVDVQSLPLRFSPDAERRGDGEVKLGYHDNNQQWTSAVRGESRGERWSFSGGLVRREADDIQTPDEPTAFDSTTPGPFESGAPSDRPAFTGTLDFTDFEQTSGQLGVGYRGDFGDVRLRYTGWRNEHNFLLPPPAGNLPPGQGPEGIGQDLENDEVQLSAELPVGDQGRWQLEPSLTWQNNLRRSNAAGNPRAELFDGEIDVEFDQYTARLEVAHGILGPFDAGTLGIEYRQKQQESRGRTQLTPGGEVDNVAVFAFEQRRIGPLVIQAGLRHDWIETTGDESETRAPTTFSGRESNDFAETTGSIGATYDFSDRLVVALNVGRGFRAPDLFELFADGVHGGVAAVQQGNPDLDPERSLNTDLGLRWRSQRLAASATFFRNRIDDFIFLQDSGTTDPGSGLPVFDFRQDDATLTGLELDARGRPVPELELSASYSIVDGENDRTDEDLPLQPADELRLEGTWSPSGRLAVREPYLRLALRYNDSKDAAPGEPFEQFDNAPFGTASTDAFTVVDLGFGFAFGGTGARPLRVDLAIHNLTDNDYRGFLDTYKGYALSPGRDFRINLRVPL